MSLSEALLPHIRKNISIHSAQGSRCRPTYANDGFTLAKFHPAIHLTAKTLRSTHPRDRGLVHATNEGCCGVAVGPKNTEWIIEVLNQLARALASQGYELLAQGKSLGVCLGEDRASISVLERAKRIPFVPTEAQLAEERNLREDYQKRLGRPAPVSIVDLWQRRPKYDFIPSGEITLEIDRTASDAQRRWRDQDRQSPDTLAREIAAGLRIAIEFRASERLRRIEEDLRDQYRQRALDRVRARETREAKRDGYLSRILETQNRILSLRAWLREAGAAGGDGAYLRLLIWANEHLASLEDSLKPSAITRYLEKGGLFPEQDELGAID